MEQLVMDILLLEDNPDDAELLAAELNRSGCDATIRRAGSHAAFLRELETPPQVVIADYKIPQYSAIDGLKATRERYQDVPFIIFSGEIPENLAIEALEMGADDFVMKDRPRRLVIAMKRAIQRAQQREKEKRDAAAMEAMVDALRLLSEQRRMLLERLTSAQEDERRRIAVDVHDDHIQMLTAISLQVQLLREDLSTANLESELGEIADLLARGISRLRRFIFELYPDSLMTDGLASMLEDYVVATMTDAGISAAVDLKVTGEPERQAEILAFRILQEAITNIKKHAQATHMLLSATITDCGVRILVEDDGRGMENANVDRPTHIGIRTMRDRVNLAGGYLQIKRSTLGGTRVDYWIPSGAMDGVEKIRAETNSDTIA